MESIHQDKLAHKLSSKHKYFQKIDNGNERIVFGGELREDLDEDIVIFVDNVPGYDPMLMKKFIQIKPEINQQINNFVQTQKLDTDSLGLHIRATDKNYRGSLRRLIQSIDKFSDHKNIKKIFLCTDNKNVEKEMIDYFTNKVVIYPKIRPENNVPLHYWAKNSNNDELKIQAAKEAVFDMFILSKTEYVLSQFGSTFSEISRVYHNEKSKENYWQIFQYVGII